MRKGQLTGAGTAESFQLLPITTFHLALRSVLSSHRHRALEHLEVHNMDQHESGRSSAADREKLLPHNRDSTESVDPEQYYHQSQQKKSSWLARSWRQLLIIGLATYSLIITSLLLKEESSLLETTLAWCMYYSFPIQPLIACKVCLICFCNIPAPARHLLTYEVKPLWDKTIDDKYAQPPSDETDAAWADLLTGAWDRTNWLH